MLGNGLQQPAARGALLRRSLAHRTVVRPERAEVVEGLELPGPSRRADRREGIRRASLNPRQRLPCGSVVAISFDRPYPQTGQSCHHVS